MSQGVFFREWDRKYDNKSGYSHFFYKSLFEIIYLLKIKYVLIIEID